MIFVRAKSRQNSTPQDYRIIACLAICFKFSTALILDSSYAELKIWSILCLNWFERILAALENLSDVGTILSLTKITWWRLSVPFILWGSREGAAERGWLKLRTLANSILVIGEKSRDSGKELFICRFCPFIKFGGFDWVNPVVITGGNPLKGELCKIHPKYVSKVKNYILR